MLALYSGTLFISALLLLWVQPMVGKMLLPLLGGTPAVWSTCIVFFQAILLAGYAYAHLLTTRLPVRAQAIIHLSLMLAAVAALPLGLPSQMVQSVPWDSDPFLWLLGVLFWMAALPFFTLSASGPLLQSWFSRTWHPASQDPYFLYAASNAGSLMGLLGYPVLVEPSLRLSEQNGLWAWLYGAGLIFFFGCAWVIWRGREKEIGDRMPLSAIRPPSGQGGKMGWSRRWRWILWAFIPSSLMLGVTTYLTTDIASVPLLWVLPLSLYLFTIILAFAQRQILQTEWMVRAFIMAAVAVVFLMLTDHKNSAWWLVVMHLVFFFLAARVYHGRLARDRPSTPHLTEFYFCMSIGGVLGGLFNTLIAPLLFRSVVEYPGVIVLAVLALPGGPAAKLSFGLFWRSLALALGIGLLTVILVLVVPWLVFEPRPRVVAVFGVPVLLCYLLSNQQPVRLGLGIGAVLLASHFYTAVHAPVLWMDRNFFGALRVTQDPEGRFFRLYHGTTLHGQQFAEPALKGEPLSYYHRTGPCGQVMAAANQKNKAREFAVIGLGIGTMACYAQSGQNWTFYEIDPAILQVARNTNYFTYLQLATHASMEFKRGDARLRLREARAEQFDLLVCDAFGSDVPPFHLLNQQALELYLSKLAPGGMLLFHVSSRYFDFRPVLGNLADAFHLKTVSYHEMTVSEEEAWEGKMPSCWVAMARLPRDFGPLWNNPRWKSVPPESGQRLWTDDYSNIIAIMR